MTKIRGILINPYAETVTEVEVEKGLKGTYAALSVPEHPVDLIDAVRLNERETMWVDDEGWLKGIKRGFQLDGYPTPTVGCGLILGNDAEGDSVSSTIPLSAIPPRIKWLGEVDGNKLLDAYPPTFQAVDENFQPVGEPQKLR